MNYLKIEGFEGKVELAREIIEKLQETGIPRADGAEITDEKVPDTLYFDETDNKLGVRQMFEIMEKYSMLRFRRVLHMPEELKIQKNKEEENHAEPERNGTGDPVAEEQNRGEGYTGCDQCGTVLQHHYGSEKAQTGNWSAIPSGEGGQETTGRGTGAAVPERRKNGYYPPRRSVWNDRG